MKFPFPEFLAGVLATLFVGVIYIFGDWICEVLFQNNVEAWSEFQRAVTFLIIGFGLGIGVGRFLLKQAVIQRWSDEKTKRLEKENSDLQLSVTDLQEDVVLRDKLIDQYKALEDRLAAERAIRALRDPPNAL
jgi:uncharacterized protein YlxW (UPF0749 family)